MFMFDLELFLRIAPALLFISLWYCFSIGITFFNKWLFHVRASGWLFFSLHPFVVC